MYVCIYTLTTYSSADDNNASFPFRYVHPASLLRELLVHWAEKSAYNHSWLMNLAHRSQGSSIFITGPFHMLRL